MIQTKEQVESIEKVKQVFSEYMEKFDDLELIKTKKAGYVLLYGIRAMQGTMVFDPVFIKDGAQLCEFLLAELAYEVLAEIDPKREHDIYEATTQERIAMEAAFEPYLEQLPEYRYLITELYKHPSDRRYDL